MHRVPQRIGLRLRSRVKKIAAGQTVGIRDPMIEPGDEIVLVGDGSYVHIEGLDARDAVPTSVRRARWCNWPQGQIWHDGRREQGIASCCRVRHVDGSGSLLTLAKSLVGDKDKSSVFHDWGASGSSKLNTPKRRDRRTVKIISGIENAVAVKEESGPVYLIGTGFRDGIDDCAGGSSVFRRVPSRDNGKFLDSIYSKIQSRGG